LPLHHSFFLGLVQGLTEFLPISSSGHLILFPYLFHWADPGLGFDAFLHLGTLLALVVFFSKEIIRILWRDWNLGLKIILACLPAAIVGLLLNNWVETNLRAAPIVAISLIFWGIVLFFADRYNGKIQGYLTKSKIGWLNALLIGFAQAIALIPGTSRSGITLTAGLFSGLERKVALRFSFLISLPVIAGAGLLESLKTFQHSLSTAQIGNLSVGFLAAFLSGLLAIQLMFKLIQNHSLTLFVIYRLILGGLILILLK